MARFIFMEFLSLSDCSKCIKYQTLMCWSSQNILRLKCWNLNVVEIPAGDIWCYCGRLQDILDWSEGFLHSHSVKWQEIMPWKESRKIQSPSSLTFNTVIFSRVEIENLILCGMSSLALEAISLSEIHRSGS